MTGEHAALGRAVGDYLAGNLVGQRMVVELRDGQGDPDHLYHSIRAHLPGLADDYVRSLLRSIQKVIEREVHRG